MATALDVCTRALRKRIKEAGLTPTSDELTDALADLNDMLAGWATTEGIDFNHVTLVSADTVDVPDGHLQTIILSLAERLTEYGSPLDPSDIMAAERGRNGLRAHYLNQNLREQSSDHPLSRRTLANDW